MHQFSLSQLYDEWLASSGGPRRGLEEQARAAWRESWEFGDTPDKVAALKFLARLHLDEGLEVAWQALSHPHDEIRYQAIETLVVLTSKAGAIRNENRDALWTYLLNRSNERRILAVIMLEQFGRLKDDERASLLAGDPDPRISIQAEQTQ